MAYTYDNSPAMMRLLMVSVMALALVACGSGPSTVPQSGGDRPPAANEAPPMGPPEDAASQQTDTGEQQETSPADDAADGSGASATAPMPSPGARRGGVPRNDILPPPLPQAQFLSRKDFIYQNDESLIYIYPGMTRKMVHALLGRYRASGWVNPCLSERRVDEQGRQYLIEFYLHRIPTRTRPIGPRTMMPVIYRKGRVDSISRYRYKKLRKHSRMVSHSPQRCGL